MATEAKCKCLDCKYNEQGNCAAKTIQLDYHEDGSCQCLTYAPTGKKNDKAEVLYGNENRY